MQTLKYSSWVVHHAQEGEQGYVVHISPTKRTVEDMSPGTVYQGDTTLRCSLASVPTSVHSPTSTPPDKRTRTSVQEQTCEASYQGSPNATKAMSTGSRKRLVRKLEADKETRKLIASFQASLDRSTRDQAIERELAKQRDLANQREVTSLREQLASQREELMDRQEDMYASFSEELWRVHTSYQYKLRELGFDEVSGPPEIAD